MKIELIPVYRALLSHAEEPDADSLWQKYALGDTWATLCRYAPMDLSARMPRLDLGKEEILRLCALMEEKIDLDALQDAFDRTAAALPGLDDDPIAVALYPLTGDDAAVVRERQNGVVGASLFGGIMLRIDPRAEDFAARIPYVFAHEYHHTVWGAYWYGQHADEIDGTLQTALITDGEADAFALSLYPALRPSWLFGLGAAAVWKLYRERYEPLLSAREFDYGALMFGDAASGIPWCAGYAVGYAMTREYMDGTGVSPAELRAVNPREIGMRDMRLADVTKDNWEAVCRLRPGADFVAPNMYSLAQAAYEDCWVARGVMLGDKLIGFAMYGFVEEMGEHELCRFMVDARYQGRGYGARALRLIVREMFARYGCETLFLSTDPANARGIHVYEAAGFVDTGTMWGDPDDREEIFRLRREDWERREA